MLTCTTMHLLRSNVNYSFQMPVGNPNLKVFAKADPSQSGKKAHYQIIV